MILTLSIKSNIINTIYHEYYNWNIIKLYIMYTLLNVETQSPTYNNTINHFFCEITNILYIINIIIGTS